jgi:hypothetical protein
MRTVAAPAVGSEVRVEPAEQPGIRVNGVPATVEHVRKADIRVDLLEDRNRSFVVEHVLGPLGLCGVTAAEVVGVREEWSFARPEHRFCYSCGLDPSHVVGHPAGLPNPELVAAVRGVGVVERAPPARRSVSEPVTFGTDTGSVTLRPREPGAGARLELRFRGEELTAEVDPAGSNPRELIDRVVEATTPFLADGAAEGITHAVADVVSDVLVIGGFEDVLVEAELDEEYHRLTVGAARRARERGLVVEKRREL